LLVVMAIIATLMGIGVGVFDNLATSDRVAAGQISDALRAARLFAVRESAPASVVVSPEDGEVFGLGLRAAGNWHFEDEDGSGWPVPARHDPGALIPHGVLGYAVAITDQSELQIPDLPGTFDSPDGFGVDVWVRPDAEPRPMLLLQRPGSWSLGLDGEGQLEVTLWLVARPSPEESRHTLKGLRLPSDRFSHVGVVFDGRRLRVTLDGLPAGEDTDFGQPRRLVTPPDAPLRTGNGSDRFRGAIDELRVASVVAGDHKPLPADVRVEGGAQVLHLDALGHLDPGYHRAPVVLSFLTGEPPLRTSVEFGLLGTVRTWNTRP
jgi:hypothetical protein